MPFKIESHEPDDAVPVFPRESGSKPGGIFTAEAGVGGNEALAHKRGRKNSLTHNSI